MVKKFKFQYKIISFNLKKLINSISNGIKEIEHKIKHT